MKKGILGKIYLSIGWILLAVAVIVVAVVLLGGRGEKLEWTELPDGSREGLSYYDNGNVKTREIEKDDSRIVERYREDGSVELIFEGKLDEKGKTIFGVEKLYDPQGELTESIEYDEYVKGFSMKRKSIHYHPDGSVKSIREIDIVENGRTISHLTRSYKEYAPDGNLVEERLYNENGNETKTVRYYTDGSVSSWNEYEYDSEGNRTKELYYDAEGKLESYREFSKKENGIEVEKTFDADGSLLHHWEFEYKDDCLAFEREYDADGNLMYYIEYERDANDMPAGQKKYDGNGNLIEIEEYKFDENGRPISRDIYKVEDGNKRLEESITYSEAGFNLMHTCYYADGKVKSLKEWYENGNLKKSESYYENGNLKRLWEYDENGNQIKSENYNEDGTKIN